MRVALIGCGKTKAVRPKPAIDLYIGVLFKLSRRYAEKTCDSILILSAKHGIVEPSRIITPYETSMVSLTPPDRLRWKAESNAILRKMNATFVFLAGSDYEGAVEGLPCVERPLSGLGIGKRLAWLKKELKKELKK